MFDKLLPLATTTWDDSEIQAAIRVIQSGNLTMGSHVEAFEKAFAEYFNTKYAVMVNSGSSANLLAISALLHVSEKPLKPGDEVIVPSLSWPTTFYPVNQCGLKLVFVDIDLSTLNISIEEIEKAITPQVKAIFVPNILGNPSNLPMIQQICDKHQLYLIEDNCESMGATLNNRSTGTYGIMGTFSTYFSHHISTIEGGVVVTDDEELYHIMLSMRSHGWTRPLPKKNKLIIKNGDSFYESFRFILPGYNIRPTEISAAIGIEQLKKLNEIIQGRQKNGRVFLNYFSENESIITQKEIGQSAWFGFSLIFASQNIRDRVATILSLNGVDVRPIVAGCILEQEVISHLNYRVVGEHGNAKKAHYHGLFIGNHHYDLQEALVEIVSIVKIYFEPVTNLATH